MSMLQVELADVTLYGLVALFLIIAWFEGRRRYHRFVCRSELTGEIEELKSNRDKVDGRREQQTKALDAAFEGWEEGRALEIEELKVAVAEARDHSSVFLNVLAGMLEKEVARNRDEEYEAEVEKIQANYWKTFDMCTERLWCLETMRRMI